MTYNDFLKIAEYGNKAWKGCFTPEEIADNANDYLTEYNYSIECGQPTNAMQSLCESLVLDMDYNDYADDNNSLTIQDMNKVLDDFINEL